jgi:RimJ/RimL family protein N-acetyltransferase
VTLSLRTSRLLLRPWRDEDVLACRELDADPAVMEYLLPRADWAAWVRAHWDEHGFGQWVVEIPGKASFIGVVGLSTISYAAHFAPASRLPGGWPRPIGAGGMPPRPLARRSITALRHWA